MAEAIRLFLIRHGNTFESGEICVQVGAKTDLELTGKGREQASRVGAYLASEGLYPEAILCGSLKRQVQTAEVIAEKLSFGDEIEQGIAALNEIDFGDWEGLTPKEIESRWPEEYSAWSNQAIWPKEFGESFERRENLVVEWLDGLRQNYSAGEVLVAVSSNGLIRLIYSLCVPAWKDYYVDERASELKVRTGSFCELELLDRSANAIRWNYLPE